MLMNIRQFLLYDINVKIRIIIVDVCLDVCYCYFRVGRLYLFMTQPLLIMPLKMNEKLRIFAFYGYKKVNKQEKYLQYLQTIINF